ncbi:hypothetical protein M3197_12090 [Sporosarcina aquimarina]|uniref:hypothetical protein n=1 Tax=Sporosarcina aquimarina TaxID=114975 RepID=UPI00203DAD1D|nr:hypothetical protein [Sporosarcina aquimarina]MCM3758205.1 hypothetical protein [Sporosarcina aquimarina]
MKSGGMGTGYLTPGNWSRLHRMMDLIQPFGNNIMTERRLISTVHALEKIFP